MRVLHITRDYPPKLIGGISTAVGDLCNALTRAGHSVRVVSFDAWRPRTNAPEPATTLDVDGVPTLRAHDLDDETLDAWADVFAPHVLHLHHDMLWPAAQRLRARTGAPVVTSVHILQHDLNALRGVESTQSSRAQAEAVAGCDLLVVASESARASLATLQPTAPIEHIPWATEAQDAAYAPDGPLISLGRFADSKGTEALWQLLIEVLAAHPQRRAVIAGGIPENPRSERKWIERWHERAPTNVQSRVDLVGWLTPEQRTQHLSAASVFVSTSLVESFGLSVLEAMAHGLPVVLTDIGAHRELCREAVTSDAMRAITDLWASPDEASRRGERARSRVREHYDWERVITQWTNAYSLVTPEPT